MEILQGAGRSHQGSGYSKLSAEQCTKHIDDKCVQLDYFGGDAFVHIPSHLQVLLPHDPDPDSHS